MRTIDRDRLDRRLAALETRPVAASDARANIESRLVAMAARMPAIPPEEARAGLLDGLPTGPGAPEWAINMRRFIEAGRL